MPPARLILRVAGTPDRDWFLTSGRMAADAIRSAMHGQHRRIEDLAALLDFGCGCGRVARHFLTAADALHGCDTAASAVRWCERHLRPGKFSVNDVAPPLPYGDGQFDLVYALSVFTHFPEELQRPWIDELWRVLAPEGHLIISVHGRAYAEALAPNERTDFDAGRLVIRDGPPGSNLCAAYHPRAFLGDLLEGRFEIADYREEGALGNPSQDLVVLRKEAPERPSGSSFAKPF